MPPLPRKVDKLVRLPSIWAWCFAKHLATTFPKVFRGKSAFQVRLPSCLPVGLIAGSGCVFQNGNKFFPRHRRLDSRPTRDPFQFGLTDYFFRKNGMSVQVSGWSRSTLRLVFKMQVTISFALDP